MKKAIIIFSVFLAAALMAGMGQYFFYYPRRYQPPPQERPPLEDIGVEPAVERPFTDEFQEQEGNVLIDLAHYNYFWLDEFSLLMFRIISRGHTLDYLRERGDLEQKLAESDAFIIILPSEMYMEDEVRLIEEFVEAGGKLFLVGDPTRPSEINSVAASFGLIFESDYLYNLTDNEGNFRYIFISDFDQEQELVSGVDKITLYTAGSISSPQKGIAFTDQDTFSSASELAQKFSPVALAQESRVLAVSDFSFMTRPYNESMDNNQFISNIADWLTTPEERVDLADFPHFLKPEVYIAYTDYSLFSPAFKLKGYLQEYGRDVKLGKYQETITGDMIFLGLFDYGQELGQYPHFDRISIEQGQAYVQDYGDIDTDETAIAFVDETEQWRAVVILAGSGRNMDKIIDGLADGTFTDWLVEGSLVVYYDPFHISTDDEQGFFYEDLESD